MNTGSRIRHYRLKLGWTLEDLETLSGVPVGSISALELRDSKKSQFFPALAKAFGLTLEQLHDVTTDYSVQDQNARFQTSARSAQRGQVDDTDKTRDYFLAEIQAIVDQINTQDLRGAASVLRTYAQNLSSPTNGHPLPMAA